MRNREEEVIRERIEQTRSRMGETIEEIGERMNPDRVKAELKARARDQVDDIKDNVKRKARDTMRDVEHEVTDTGRSIWATIRENPVPAGMVGIGLAWLVSNRKDASSHYRYGADLHRGGPSVPYRTGRDMGYTGGAYTAAGAYTTGGYSAATPRPGSGRDYTYDSGVDTGVIRDRNSGSYTAGSDSDEGVRERAEHAAANVRDRAEHVADSAREKAGEVAGTVRDSAHDAVDAVREKASHVADRASHQFENVQHRVGHWSDEAQYYARRAERRVEYAVQDNPVAAGAVAMAIGLAAGLMIPESQKEHELMGRARDKVMDRAGERAREASQKARQVAKEKIGESAEHLVDEVWPEGNTDAGAQASTAYTEPRR